MAGCFTAGLDVVRHSCKFRAFLGVDVYVSGEFAGFLLDSSHNAFNGILSAEYPTYNTADKCTHLLLPRQYLLMFLSLLSFTVNSSSRDKINTKLITMHLTSSQSSNESKQQPLSHGSDTQITDTPT